MMNATPGPRRICVPLILGLLATCTAGAWARAGTPAPADPPELKEIKFNAAYLKAPQANCKLVEVRILDKHNLIRPHQIRAYINNDGYYIDKTGTDAQLTLKTSPAPGGGKEYVLTLRPKRVVPAGRHLLNIWSVPKRGQARMAFREFSAADSSRARRKKLCELFSARIDADLVETRRYGGSLGTGVHPSAAEKAALKALRARRRAADDAYSKYKRLPEVKRWLINQDTIDPRGTQLLYALEGSSGRAWRSSSPLPGNPLDLARLDDGYVSLAEYEAAGNARKKKYTSLLLDNRKAAPQKFLLNLRIEGPGIPRSYQVLECPTVPRRIVLKGTVVNDRGKPVSKARVICERMSGNNAATTAADGSFTIACTMINERSWTGSFTRTDLKLIVPASNPVAQLLSALDSVPIGDTSLSAEDDRELASMLKLALLGPEYFGTWGRNQKQLAPLMKAAREENQKAYDANARGRAFYSMVGNRLRPFGELSKATGYTRRHDVKAVDTFISESGRTAGAPVRARFEELRNETVALMQRLDSTWKKKFKLEATLRGPAGRQKSAMKTLREINALQRRGRELQRRLAPLLARWEYALRFANQASLDALKNLPNAPPPLELKFAVKSKSGASIEAKRYFYCEPKELAISGRVTDAAGNPLAGAKVTVADREATTTTATDGSYKLLIKGKGKLKLRRGEVNFRLASFQLVISADRPGYKAASLSLPCREMPGSVNIAGKVLDVEGLPLAGATVALLRPSAGARAVSAGDGSFRLEVAKLAAGGKPLTRDDVEMRLAWGGKELSVEFDTPHKPWTIGGRKLEKWVFLQAEAVEFSVRLLHRGKPVKKPRTTLNLVSPRVSSGSAAHYKQLKKDQTWTEDGTRLVWKGVLPAHASPGQWAVNIDTKFAGPDGKEIRIKDTKFLEVREDHRMTAEKLEENFQWVQREWSKRCEVGVVRRMYPNGLVANHDYHGINMARNLARFVLPGYPKGKMGPVNNLLALYHNPPGVEWAARKICGTAAKGDQSFFRYTCGGYAARALNIMNGWRHSEDYQTRRRLLGVDYTPVYHWPHTAYRNAWLNHIAVLVYKSGYKGVRRPTALNYGNRIKAHRVRPDDSAVVLEPWLNQKPLIMKASAWMKTFTDGTGMGLPAVGDGWDGYALIPGLGNSDYTHKRILDDKRGKDDVGGRLLGQLTSIPRTRILSLSPVNLIITDQRGRRAGVTADGKVLGEIPGISVEFWPDGKHMSQHVFLPTGKYKVNVSSTGKGKFGLAIIDSRRDPLIYAKANVIGRGEKARLDLSTGVARPALILPGGKKASPEVVPLRADALALKKKLDRFGTTKTKTTPKPEPQPMTTKAPQGTSWLAFEKRGFWIAKPDGWLRGKAKADLAAQLVEKNKDAFVEVYTDKVRPAALEKLAEAWEQGIRKRMPTVFARRSKMSDLKLSCGTPAQFRKYNGKVGGAKVTARVVFTARGNRAWVAVGIYVDKRSKSFKSLVMKTVSSLRLKKP